MEISSVDLHNVVPYIARQLEGYYVNNIYAVSSTSILFKLHHPLSPERQLVISPTRGIWLTKYELEGRSSEGFVRALRTNLERKRFLRISQPPGERIVILEFEGQNGTIKVIGEFFGQGNIALVDASDKIIACQRAIKVRHRRIAPGEKYALPPSKGIDFFRVTLDDLLRARGSSLEVSRWLGREISLSRKYVEELLTRAGVDKSFKCFALSLNDIERIYYACRDIATALSDSAIRGIVILENSNPMDFVPAGFVTFQGKHYFEKDSLAEAVDDVLCFDLKHEQEVSANEPQLQKLGELKKSLQDQAKAREATLSMASKLREVANKIIYTWGARPINISEFQSSFNSDVVSVSQSVGKNLLKFGEDSFELHEDVIGMKIASKLFDEAKRLEYKAKLIEQAEARLAEQEEKLLVEVHRETEKGKLAVRPEPLWFERYRWLKTSEGLLTIGGRDARSNTAIIRKHLSKNDIILHAEIIGSPFFVIKDASESNVQSINEVAKAVVSFSRAWREGIKVADAFWVKFDQVKLQAPSGMFLQKGSFLIEGKKNFIRSINLELAVGACTIEERDTLMAGPVEAVEKNCHAYVVLVPDDLKTTETARKVKAEIISLLDENLAKSFKRIPIDDFVRVLPSGGGRIVGKARGGEKD